jgi:hypothetical protein
MGVPLALYTGLVASRIFAFYRARYRSVLWFYDLSGLLRQDFSNPHDFVWKLLQHGQPIAIELKAQGHDSASLAVSNVMHSFVAVAAQVCQVPPLKGQTAGLPRSRIPRTRGQNPTRSDAAHEH